MRLYLSSFFLGRDTSALAALVRRPTAVVVGNALDHAVNGLRASFVQRSMSGLTGLGLSVRPHPARHAPGRLDGCDGRGLRRAHHLGRPEPDSVLHRPHYRSDHPDSRGVDAMVEYFLANTLPFVALRDGEVVVYP